MFVRARACSALPSPTNPRTRRSASLPPQLPRYRHIRARFLEGGDGGAECCVGWVCAAREARDLLISPRRSTARLSRAFFGRHTHQQSSGPASRDTLDLRITVSPSPPGALSGERRSHVRWSWKPLAFWRMRLPHAVGSFARTRGLGNDAMKPGSLAFWRMRLRVTASPSHRATLS